MSDDQRPMSDRTTHALQVMRERLAKPLAESNGRAVLMFSGGRDSTAIAALFAHTFPHAELHWLMIDNGLLSRVDSTLRQSRLLRRLFPDMTFEYEVKRASQMMRAAVMQHIEADFTKRNYPTLLACVGCKAVMNFSAMSYAKSLGISLVLDGYAERQSDFPEQTKEFMDQLHQLYREAKVNYVSPMYDVFGEKKIVQTVLADLGVSIEKQEAVCMFADAFSPSQGEHIAHYTEQVISHIRQLDPQLHC